VEDSVPGKLDALTTRVAHIEKAVAENTDLTRDIRDAMVAGRVMTKVLKWCGAIAAACSALWVAWVQFKHGGKAP
jgi:hypothetical protein